MNGTELIAAERERQVSEEGWTPEHDAQHDTGQLVAAALAYLTPDEDRLPHPSDLQLAPDGFPWGDRFWKPSPDDRVRELVKAGALIAAEIDRLQRVSLPAAHTQGAKP